MRTISKTTLRLADEVWIITALLHREFPLRSDFSIEEILDRARRENLSDSLRPGFYVHVVQHCVANRRPNPARYRMLYETTEGRRRLFRLGDSYHFGREGSKILPAVGAIPDGYQGLVSWYHDWVSAAVANSAATDPLLHLANSGSQVWADEPTDDYVRRLREGWE